MQRSLQGNGRLNPRPAIRSSISKNSFDNNLLGVAYNKQTASTLKIIKAHMSEGRSEDQVISVKPQQLLAGMVFRAFGLQSLPLNALNKRIIYLANYTGQNTIELGVANTLNKIKHVVQLVNTFNNAEGRAEKTTTYQNSVAEYKSDLTACTEEDDVVSFSKVIGDKEITIIYNASEIDAKEKFIMMHTNMGKHVIKMNTVYGYDNCGHVHLFNGIINDRFFSYIKIYLKPLQLIVLKNFQ